MAQRPVYIDVYTEMLRDIQTGLYPENSLFPPEEKLCRKYNASRSTLRRALNMLKETGVLYSVQGNGTYIKPFVFTQPLSDFYSFTDTLKSSNILIQNSVIHYDLVKADKSLAIETGYQEGTVFHKLFRLRSARTYPLMLETTFLPQSRFLTLDTEALSCGSLYEFCENSITSMQIGPRKNSGLLCRAQKKGRCCISHPMFRVLFWSDTAMRAMS